MSFAATINQNYDKIELNLYYLEIVGAICNVHSRHSEIHMLAKAGSFQKQRFRLPAGSRYQQYGSLLKLYSLMSLGILSLNKPTAKLRCI